MKMRKDLLISLLEMNNVSGKEFVIIPKVVEELTNLGFEVSIDDIGNVSAVRGEASQYPLINAHLDQVDYWGGYYSKWNTSSYSKGLVYSSYYGDMKEYDKDWKDYYDDDEDDGRLLEVDSLDEIFDMLTTDDVQRYMTCQECSKKTCPARDLNMPCELISLNADGYLVLYDLADEWGIKIKDDTDNVIVDTKKIEEPYSVYESKGCLYGTGSDRVLGGDDKCGIFIALEVARLMIKMPMKILFTVKEEEGCIGISHFIKNNESWFDDVAYSITIDRRYGDNLLWRQLGKQSCSNEFACRLALAGLQAGITIKFENGSVADVIHIREIVKESVNISAGYYNPHDVDEYVKLEDVTRIIKWVRNFVKNENLEG